MIVMISPLNAFVAPRMDNPPMVWMINSYTMFQLNEVIGLTVLPHGPMECHLSVAPARRRKLWSRRASPAWKIV